MMNVHTVKSVWCAAAAAAGGGAGVDWRPRQASVLHCAEGGGLGNESHPCSLSVSQGHMGAPDKQAAIQEAEWTMENPFPFFIMQKRVRFENGTHISSCVVAWQGKNGGWAVEGVIMYPL